MERHKLDGAASDVPIKATLDALDLRPKTAGAIAFSGFVLGRHESGSVPIVLNPARKRLPRDLDSWVIRTIGS